MSAKAEAEGGGGGDGGNKSGTGPLSTSTSGVRSSPLGGSSATSYGPAAGGEKKSASPRLAVKTGPEGL